MLRNRRLFAPFLLLCAFALGAFAGGEISSGEARRLIARAGGANLKTQDIHIRRIDEAPGGQTAVVEALVQLAFRLTRKDGAWKVSEIRVGDRQWDDLDLIRAGMDAEKTRRTREDLTVVAAAVDAYRRSRGALPAAKSFSELVDTLLPDFLPRIIREDSWDRPLEMQMAPPGFKLFSSGPDGRPRTKDDIVVEAP